MKNMKMFNEKCARASWPIATSHRDDRRCDLNVFNVMYLNSVNFDFAPGLFVGAAGGCPGLRRRNSAVASSSDTDSQVTGKPEAYVAVCINDRASIIWAGQETPCALGHGLRSRSQILPKFAGTENMLI